MASIKMYRFRNTEVYKVDSTDLRSIQKLFNDNYIIIYDESIFNQGNKLILAKNNLSTEEYYKILKFINIGYYVVGNMIDIGYICFEWNFHN
ncbi:hypothetical protein FDJ70_06070 [Clostridium botulinum]|uniref:hypothetical protein n=1 Tax=Clostridium botulinum TaxID=1491 RepID=UPI0013F7BCBA|nr:hypothetical protein [Clostridium botulinum]MCD3217354.1 hypothetical protein [Clostridium botulinum C]NFV47239.1 hypothetical protein [Clostridium botulinum]